MRTLAGKGKEPGDSARYRTKVSDSILPLTLGAVYSEFSHRPFVSLSVLLLTALLLHGISCRQERMML